MLKYVAGATPGKQLPTTDRKSRNDYEKSRKREFQEKWSKISDEGEATSGMVSDKEDLQDGSDDKMNEEVVYDQQYVIMYNKPRKLRVTSRTACDAAKNCTEKDIRYP
ncbi:hypothetical protein DPMN_003685 [Dreissena polymorpha]|uniref:Uncharacterized protein n=1 Tax=Dreissena polymorpha TaxID=45954 RepID=A0A9D4RSV4_DREPO|nr:hypothetical protein DPMN_003685 [Dreissena polymorpha]